MCMHVCHGKSETEMQLGGLHAKSKELLTLLCNASETTKIYQQPLASLWLLSHASIAGAAARLPGKIQILQ